MKKCDFRNTILGKMSVAGLKNALYTVNSRENITNRGVWRLAALYS